MPINFCQRTAMAAAIAACFPLAHANNVARVDFASGDVFATGADGRSRALSKGSEIQVGETVATQAGRAQLRFSDGAYMSLQPQTEFRIEEFKFAGKADGSENIVMNLLKGGMRTITGLIGRNNRNAYRLKTDVATIGIRGTEYSVRYTNSIELFVTDGAISVDNQSGSFVVPGGTGVMVSNQNTPPQQTDQKPVLPPESPSQQQQEEVTKKAPDPVNPIQEAMPTLPRLTGTIEGGYAYSQYSLGAAADSPVTPITLDAEGKLLSFLDTYEGAALTSVGSASNELLGNDGIIAWGRWIGHMNYLETPFDTEGNPFHWIVGLPATNLPPMGTATVFNYDLMGSSVSCLGSGCTGATLVSAQTGLSVNFQTYAVTLNMGVAIAGGVNAGTWTFNQEFFGTNMTPAGLFFMSGAMTGPGSGGWTFANGFLSGSGAPRAGAAFQGYVYTYTGVYEYTDLNGVAAFRKK